MKENWDIKHFNALAKVFPPAKPSISEINSYKEEMNTLKVRLKRKLDVLILGTTVEFIDLALREKANITIIDSSEEYNNIVCNDLKYQSGNIRSVICRWEDMPFKDEFDVIIGDCVIGNIDKENVEDFFFNIRKSLRSNGLFLCKNFLISENYKKKSINEIIENYKENEKENPFTYMIYDLVVLFSRNQMIDFKKIYNCLKQLNNKGSVSKQTLDYFSGIMELGEINCKFYIPTVEEYEKIAKKYLNIKNIKYGKDVYAKDIPLYIMEKCME